MLVELGFQPAVSKGNRWESPYNELAEFLRKHGVKDGYTTIAHSSDSKPSTSDPNDTADIHTSNESSTLESVASTSRKETAPLLFAKEEVKMSRWLMSTTPT